MAYSRDHISTFKPGAFIRAISMGVNINDLPDRYKKQARRQVASQNRDTRNRSDMEPSNIAVAKRNKRPSSARRLLILESKKQVQRPLIQSPVRILVTFFRKRLPDFEGCPTKWPVDALVESRVLQDDGRKYVHKVEKDYAKVKTEEEEKTVIEIFED